MNQFISDWLSIHIKGTYSRSRMSDHLNANWIVVEVVMKEGVFPRSKHLLNVTALFPGKIIKPSRLYLSSYGWEQTLLRANSDSCSFVCSNMIETVGYSNTLVLICQPKKCSVFYISLPLSLWFLRSLVGSRSSSSSSRTSRIPYSEGRVRN